MSVLNIDHIINGTPQKRLNNGYKLMKENYTVESAQDYYEIYSKEPLSFLLENSNLIFSEPYKGTAFFEKVFDGNVCCFTALEKEKEKVESFLEKYGSNMGAEQKKLYENLHNVLESVSVHTKNTQIYASYIKENIDAEFEEKLSDALYAYENSEEKNNEEIMNLFESVTSPVVFFTYAPYVTEAVSYHDLKQLTDIFLEKCDVSSDCDADQWRNFTEAVVCCNKLSKDISYMESVKSIPKATRTIFEYFMNASLSDKIMELVTENVSEDIHYQSPVSAINNIFTDMYEAAVDKEENDAYKDKIELFKGIAYESTMNLLVSEYQNTDDTSMVAEGYSLVTNGLTVEEAFDFVLNRCKEYNVITEAADDEDVSDDDIKNMDDEVNGGNDTGKKSKAPKAKNLANKVQFKAMDAEAQQLKNQAVRSKKGQEITNAVRAVSKLPLNVLNSIKSMTKKIDDADDERRKKYMTEPGFRKKGCRNMKLALLYGTAAQAKLAFVPIVAMCRHYSKRKDIRIRNDLIRELNTEIKVCEEKISDANSNGDTKEKYKLMRIRDQLETEMLRVKTNSKYI